MRIHIRLLEQGDESILAELAHRDSEFDVEGRSEGLEPLDEEGARRFLQDPAVLFWIALDGTSPVGFLYCIDLPLRSSPGRELLLYEIGVRNDSRRRGVGRLLVETMSKWMDANGVADVWVLADNPTAEAFYRSCGFSTDDSMSLYMTLTR